MTNTLGKFGANLEQAGARLTVDLSALVRNWRKLDALSAPARAAAVVKANAYGLGSVPVVEALYAAGCRNFFVALPEEGTEIRKVAQYARVFVLTGAFGNNHLYFRKNGLVPLLCSNEQIDTWLNSALGAAPFGINVDTGMNRLGLAVGDALRLSERLDSLKKSGLCHIMSHLACADQPSHSMNGHQLEAFQRIRGAYVGVESSLGNSAGVFLGGDFACDVTRPGIALYGGEAVSDTENPMEPIATAETRIIQIRRAKAGETVSYGATMTLARDTLIAVCGTGYSDGYHRASGHGVALRQTIRPAGFGFVAGTMLPILGRVTMDLTMFDITDTPKGLLNVGDFIELFGKNIKLDDVARAAGTIGYEFLTSLGDRYHRSYISDLS